MAYRSGESEQAQETKKAMSEWFGMNQRDFLDLLAVGALETVRRNGPLQSLATSKHPISAADLKRGIPDYDALDWTGMDALWPVFENLMQRKKSKKGINRFTLNFTTILKDCRPEIVQEDVICQKRPPFCQFIENRVVSETSWRNLLF